MQMENVTSRSSSEINTELAARRTGMSFQRTRMSADRTLMSIIRTSLSLISFGFTIFQVFQKLKDNNALAGAPVRRDISVWRLSPSASRC
jgi:inner membrane protein YidH